MSKLTFSKAKIVLPGDDPILRRVFRLRSATDIAFHTVMHQFNKRMHAVVIFRSIYWLIKMCFAQNFICIQSN